MAGIGFELKKLFAHRGALSAVRAYGYTAIICAGPMLLSIGLLIGIRILAAYRDDDQKTLDLLSAMVTYCLVASLSLGSILSMVTTRFVADMLYDDKHQWVLPSLYGSLALLLGAGGVGYGVFLSFSGISVWYQALNFVLFSELTIVWTQMNYLMAIKGYRSILILFACGVAAALLYGYVAINRLTMDTVTALMSAVILGYGVILCGFFVLLHRYFPWGEGSIFRFLAWVRRYPSLLCVGLFLTVGLFAHIVLMWSGPLGLRISGLFFAAPQYDIPAFVASLSLLVSTINFTVSMEVQFYPLYREYIDLFNNGGTLNDIQLAEDEMLLVMRRELSYLGYRQFVASVLFVILATPMLLASGLGFTDTMLGTFRVLCIGYGLYGIANSILLMQLYFADNTGAFCTSLVFMAASITGTLGLRGGEPVYYGFGLLLAGALMYLVAWVRLSRFTAKLQHHILSVQSVFGPSTIGPVARFSLVLKNIITKRGTPIPPHRASTTRSVSGQ